MLNQIDHTILKPTTTISDVSRVCQECVDYGFRSICIPPTFVQGARRANDNIKIATVIGFPLGFHRASTKVEEAKKAIAEGANELDVVWDIGAFLDRQYLRVLEELVKIIDIDSNIKVKVIVEECYLSTSDLNTALNIVIDSGAYAIKTSTGYGSRGATLSTVKFWDDRLTKEGSYLRIKAAGGIKTVEQFLAFTEAADIIGTSNSVVIAKGLKDDRSVC
jgi:deoxyribose-phosphate aldolase